MEKFAKWDLQAVRVHLVICNDLDELKARWKSLQPVMKKHLSPGDKIKADEYKNELKEKFINQTVQ